MIFELISKVLINVLLISMFICIFFFTYGIYLEKLTIANQMKILADNFTDTFKLFGNSINKNLYNYININLLSAKNIEKIKKDDDDALKGNPKIMNKVVFYIFLFFMSVVIIVGALKWIQVKNTPIVPGAPPNDIFNIKKILIESFIVLVFIGLTEFSFLHFFGPQFVSINTNNVKLQVFKDLEKYSKLLNKKIVV